MDRKVIRNGRTLYIQSGVRSFKEWDPDRRTRLGRCPIEVTLLRRRRERDEKKIVAEDLAEINDPFYLPPAIRTVGWNDGNN